MSQNRLPEETSPYLLQHRDNPVHWWAWGPEALDEARRLGKPILLSVGYAACHWCHVMAHESFEDQSTADVMNEHFINIKVDREERPDIDQIYMAALHQLGEQGGWPLTMFLDSSGKPFFGGTYFPKHAKFERPAFIDVLENVARIYREAPDKVLHNATVITAALKDRSENADPLEITDDTLRDLTQRMTAAVDPVQGGINGAPKFPQWSFFWLLWRGGIRYENDDAQGAVETTLRNICHGGIYDHIAGGFSRYSVDERWLVPHFEKMLYDNALLIDLMTEVYRETHDPLLATRIEETVGWLEREMIGEGGGFAASLDADSEGKEGKFYVWSMAEIYQVLGEIDAEMFCAAYDITEEGNWEGTNIPNRLDLQEQLTNAEEATLKEMRGRLLSAREERVRPGWDDKILADWNGLMIAALAQASNVFKRLEWLDRAKQAFSFVQSSMQVDGRLRHAYRSGQAKAPATANDYANMIWAALRLYEATLDKNYLQTAIGWSDVLEAHYWVEDDGGYAMSAKDTDDVIVRLCNARDEATPNANATMVANLVHLAALTGDQSYLERAEKIVEVFASDANKNLMAHAGLLAGAMEIIAPQQIAIVGADKKGGKSLVEMLHTLSLPGSQQFIIDDATPDLSAPALVGKTAAGDKATAYVCLGPQCSAPITDPQVLEDVLRDRRSAGRMV
ncbi:MAG: thioredoxin domain-containing protein [Hyphomicrobiaceae bacterium]